MPIPHRLTEHASVDDPSTTGLRPDFSCFGCGHEWVDAQLPPWWPPVPPDDLTPHQYDLAHHDLAERTERTSAVVEALRIGGPAAARSALNGALDWIEQRYGQRQIDAGLPEVVVPRDCTILADVLGAAVEVCWAMEQYTRPGLFPLEEDFQALYVADEAFRHAAEDLRRFGRTDFAQQPDDEDEDEDEDDWLTPEDRFAAAARTGDGNEIPPVGEEWDDWLADIAAGVFRADCLG